MYSEYYEAVSWASSFHTLEFGNIVSLGSEALEIMINILGGTPKLFQPVMRKVLQRKY